MDGDGNIIDDKKIVEEVEESCDPEVCMSAIKKKTAKHHEDENNTTIIIDAVNASKDAPSNDLEVVVTEALLEEPPKHHGRKSIKSKKNCHAGHQYSKLPKFNYNYKVSDAYIFYTFVLD